MARKRRRKTDITLWDHVLLQNRLASRPEDVLKKFRAAQIGCLMELDCYRRLVETAPDVATRIAAIAVSMGIPVETAI